MRLSSKELQSIVSSVRTLLKKKSFQLYLFGSRTDDLKKGGDIDLLLLTIKENKDEFVSLKSAIRYKIFESIPEQKIDITVVTSEDLKSNLFLKSVFPSAILLTENNLGHSA